MPPAEVGPSAAPELVLEVSSSAAAPAPADKLAPMTGLARLRRPRPVRGARAAPLAGCVCAAGAKDTIDASPVPPAGSAWLAQAPERSPTARPASLPRPLCRCPWPSPVPASVLLPGGTVVSLLFSRASFSFFSFLFLCSFLCFFLSFLLLFLSFLWFFLWCREPFFWRASASAFCVDSPGDSTALRLDCVPVVVAPRRVPS